MGKHHSERFVTFVDDAKTRIEEITPEEIKEKIDTGNDFVLLDVREQDEWKQSHISGASYLGRGVIERDIAMSNHWLAVSGLGLRRACQLRKETTNLPRVRFLSKRKTKRPQLLRCGRFAYVDL